MKGINSFDENGYWSRYSNDNWSVRKIYDDVIGYEYALSGERFDALEVVDKLASLESQLAEAKARLAGYEWIPVSERLPEDRATILAAFKNREILTATYYEHYEGFGGVENYWHIEGWHSGEVTHWMPLPEAPKEDE